MPTSRLASVLEARLCSQGSHGGDSSAAAAAFRTALQHQQAVSRHFQRTKMHNGHRSTSGRGSAGKNVHTRTDCVEFEVLVDGTRQPQSMAAVLFDDLVWPLAVYLYARTLTTPHGKRLLVGLGGAGGSGKSVTCALLAQVVNALHRMMRGSPDAGAAPATTSELCTAVSMDAYHFTNDYLLSQPIGTQGKTLKSVKGRPETFNVAALVNDLRRLAEGGQVLMPVYDRCLHDPVQEVHAVKLAHRLVLVEGLYVGVYAQQSHVGNNREEEIALRKYLGDWSAVQSILDVTAYLQVPESVAVRRLLRRKTTQANPKPRKEILAHINTVDVPTLCQLDELASRNCEFIFNVGFADPEYDDTARLDSVSVQQPKVKPLSTHSRRSSGTNKNTILVVGLNPALQKTWEFSSDLALGEVNRASSLSLSIGGKGQQLAHACAHAQGLFPCRVSLCQFLGGPAGDQIATMLDCFKDDIEQITVRINAATRSCHTLLDGQGGATELIEPSGRVSQEEREQLMADIAKQFLPTHEGTPSRVGAVAIAGTFPPGITGDFYARVAKAAGYVTLLDGYRGVEEVLATELVQTLKINRIEFEEILAAAAAAAGLDVKSRTPEAEAERLQQVFSTFKLQWIAVTAGGGVSELFHYAGQRWEFVLPPQTKGTIVNPIGAGDTVSAVLLAGLLNGIPMVPAFATALAAGTASCLRIQGSSFSEDEVHTVLSGLVVRERHSCISTSPLRSSL